MPGRAFPGKFLCFSSLFPCKVPAISQMHWHQELKQKAFISFPSFILCLKIFSYLHSWATALTYLNSALCADIKAEVVMGFSEQPTLKCWQMILARQLIQDFNQKSNSFLDDCNLFYTFEELKLSFDSSTFLF